MEESSDESVGGRPRATSVLRTSSRRITPSFSSLNSPCWCLTEKRWKASFISVSSSAVMLFSFASLDWRGFLRVEVVALVRDEGAAPPRLLGGWIEIDRIVSSNLSGYVSYLWLRWLYRRYSPCQLFREEREGRGER